MQLTAKSLKFTSGDGRGGKKNRKDYELFMPNAKDIKNIDEGQIKTLEEWEQSFQ